MRYRKLGRMNWPISEISMGSYNTFDVPKEDKKGRQNVRAVIQAAIEQGTNLFDTANMYGNSEAAIGEALTILKEEGVIEYGIPYKQSSGNVPKIYIATKVWASSIQEAENQIQNSFKVLQTDFIDLFQIHNLSIWENLIPILGEMRDEERIGAVGVTHYAEATYPEMLKAMRTGDIDVVQVPYNTNQTVATREIFPGAQKLDLGVLIMTPITQLFRKGFLVGQLSNIDLKRFEKYGCRTPGQVLLKFVISHPAVTCAIPATSKVSHVTENTVISNGIDMDKADQEFLINLF
jgi:aryl-alcohol dehydrogenase-like predicted oxidoreductase